MNDLFEMCVGLFSCFAEAVIFFLFYETFLTKRENLNKCVYAAGVIILAALIYTSNHVFSISVLNLLCVFISEILVSSLYDGKWQMRIFSAALGLMSSAMAEMLIFVCLSVILNLDTAMLLGNILYRVFGVIVSKLLGIVLAFFICRRAKKQEELRETNYWLLFSFVFASAIISSYVFFVVISKGADIRTRYLILAAIIGIMITSVIVLYLHETMLKQQRLTEQLKHKNEIDFTKYNMLKDKYADLRVMAHDFNKYCKSIEGMLGENSNATLEMIRSLESKNRSLLLVEYTDNDALNVLLTQKSEECSQSGIDFQIYIQNVSLSFIDEADTVAIFANLMDNAIEASGKSAAKKIFLSIYEMNSAFTVIRLDNSADSEPVTEGGVLMTSKSDRDLHGIGTVSIKQALRKYGGDMEWSYDRDEKKFNTTILINHIDFSKKN